MARRVGRPRRSYRRSTVRRRSRRRRSAERFVPPKIQANDYNEFKKVSASPMKENFKPAKMMEMMPERASKNQIFKKGYTEGFKEGVEHFRRRSANYDEDY